MVHGPEDVVWDMFDFINLDDLATLTYGCPAYEMMI